MTYNSDFSCCMAWPEFLAFLSGRLNPYVTLSLFPKVKGEGGGLEKDQETLEVSDEDVDGGSNPR